MGWIQLEGMEFYAYHGHFKEEQIVGNEFVIDLSIEANLEPAAASDNIEDALDYQSIYNLVQDEMKKKSALLENIADRIIEAIYIEFPDQVDFIKLKISKLNPPLKGKLQKISITMSR